MIDSIAFHFRYDHGDLGVRARLLNGMAQALIKLAHKHQLAVRGVRPQRWSPILCLIPPSFALPAPGRADEPDDHETAGPRGRGPHRPRPPRPGPRSVLICAHLVAGRLRLTLPPSCRAWLSRRLVGPRVHDPHRPVVALGRTVSELPCALTPSPLVPWLMLGRLALVSRRIVRQAYLLKSPTGAQASVEYAVTVRPSAPLSSRAHLLMLLRAGCGAGRRRRASAMRARDRRTTATPLPPVPTRPTSTSRRTTTALVPRPSNEPACSPSPPSVVHRMGCSVQGPA